MIHELLQFIEQRKSAKVFAGWRITDPDHRRYVVLHYATGLLFCHRAGDSPSGAIDGVGVAELLGDNQVFAKQLIADNTEARVSIIKQFIAKFPGAIIVAYDRRGRRKVVKDSAKLLKHILHKGYGKRPCST